MHRHRLSMLGRRRGGDLKYVVRYLLVSEERENVREGRWACSEDRRA